MISLLFVAVNSALLGRALFFTAITCFWMGLQLHKLQLATGGKLLLGERGIVIIIQALKGPVHC